MPSNSEKKIDSVFEHMTFQERVIFIFNLGFNQQTRDQVEHYEKRMPIEQRLALSQIRCALSAYLDDKVIHDLYLRLAEIADTKTIENIKEIMELNECQISELYDFLSDLRINNQERWSNLLSARIRRSDMEKARENYSDYITALDLDFTFGKKFYAVKKLTTLETETVDKVADIELLIKMENEDFSNVELDKIQKSLLVVHQLGLSRLKRKEEELERTHNGTEDTFLEEIKEKMKRFGHYDII